MSGDGGGHVVKVDELPGGENASTFDGYEHGAQVSFFLSRNRPGTGPKLHRHPYEETFIVQEGDVLFTDPAGPRRALRRGGPAAGPGNRRVLARVGEGVQAFAAHFYPL